MEIQYGTIITKDYPDDAQSELDPPERFRVNVHVGRDRAQSTMEGDDPAERDTYVTHPLYASAGWVSVVNPGARASDTLLRLLRDAHESAKVRTTRRDRLL